jgi:hypothetical protein
MGGSTAELRKHVHNAPAVVRRQVFHMAGAGVRTSRRCLVQTGVLGFTYLQFRSIVLPLCTHHVTVSQCFNSRKRRLRLVKCLASCFSDEQPKILRR